MVIGSSSALHIILLMLLSGTRGPSVYCQFNKITKTLPVKADLVIYRHVLGVSG